MDSIRRWYILRYEEEHNRPNVRDNEPTSQYDQIHTWSWRQWDPMFCGHINQTCRQKTHIQHRPQIYGHFSIHSNWVSPQHPAQISNLQLHDSSPCYHTTEFRWCCTTELNEIKTIAKINGYSEQFFDRIHNKHKKKDELRNLTTLILVLKRDDAPTNRHAITFYPAITNKLQRIFWNHQIDLLYSNKGQLKDSLGNPKDKTELLRKSGIYQVECEGCDFV
jgi:hypothetical protein